MTDIAVNGGNATIGVNIILVCLLSKKFLSNPRQSVLYTAVCILWHFNVLLSSLIFLPYYISQNPMHDVDSVLLSCKEARGLPGQPPAPFETTVGSLCMYDFGVIYLLDDHKQALADSLKSFLEVSKTMPKLPRSDYKGHFSLMSNSVRHHHNPITLLLIYCNLLPTYTSIFFISQYFFVQVNKSLSDLPDAHNLNQANTNGVKTNGDSDFVCTICNFTCKSNVLLKVHVRIHEGEKPFSCTLCRASFDSKKQLLGSFLYFCHLVYIIMHAYLYLCINICVCIISHFHHPISFLMPFLILSINIHSLNRPCVVTQYFG